MRTHLGARTNPLRTLPLLPFAVGSMVTLQNGSLLSSVQHCCWRIWFRRNPEIGLIPTCWCPCAVFTWATRVSFCWSVWRAHQGTCGAAVTEPCRCRCLLPQRLNHSLLSMGCIDSQFFLPAHTYLGSAFELFWCSARSPGLYRCFIDSVPDLSAFFQMSQDPHSLCTALSASTWGMQWALDLHWQNANHVRVGIQSKPAPGPPPSSVKAVVTCSPHHSATPTSALHLLHHSHHSILSPTAHGGLYPAFKQSVHPCHPSDPNEWPVPGISPSVHATEWQLWCWNMAPGSKTAAELVELPFPFSTNVCKAAKCISSCMIRSTKKEY